MFTKYKFAKIENKGFVWLKLKKKITIKYYVHEDHYFYRGEFWK